MWPLSRSMHTTCPRFQDGAQIIPSGPNRNAFSPPVWSVTSRDGAEPARSISRMRPSAVRIRTAPSGTAVQIRSPAGVNTRSSDSPANGPTTVSIAPVARSSAKTPSPIMLAAQSRPSGPNAIPLTVRKPDPSTIRVIAWPGATSGTRAFSTDIVGLLSRDAERRIGGLAGLLPRRVAMRCGDRPRRGVPREGGQAVRLSGRERPIHPVGESAAGATASLLPVCRPGTSVRPVPSASRNPAVQRATAPPDMGSGRPCELPSPGGSTAIVRAIGTGRGGSGSRRWWLRDVSPMSGNGGPAPAPAQGSCPGASGAQVLGSRPCPRTPDRTRRWL